VDVSAEGLRLEVPADSGDQLPAYFNVRVPLVDVAVTVQRMWSRSTLARGPVLCGGVLSRNRSAINDAWRRFAERVPATHDPNLLLNP